MSYKNYIVGINCAHDASVCIMSEDNILIATCEERFNRIKHYSGFPSKALVACMNSVGYSHNCTPKRVVINQMPPSDNERIIKEIWPKLDINKITINPSHHLLHALYAHVSSGFSNSVHLVLDGSGYSYAEYLRNDASHVSLKPLDWEACESLSIFNIENNKINEIHRDWGIWIENTNMRYRFPSLGHMFSLAAQIIFGDWIYAGKVMGLAPYGDPDFFDFQIVTLNKIGITIDTDWVLKFSHMDINDSYENTPDACNIAAKVQSELEKAIIHLAKIIKKNTHALNLCLSGGVALNSVANGKLIDTKLFKNIHFSPAAGDSGVSIGAACYGSYLETGMIPKIENYSDSLGVIYSYEKIKKAVESYCSSNIKFEKVDTPARKAAQDIANGMIVGWFEGRSEFGPRALGKRSILADPRNAKIKDFLNSSIKFREHFRPFAIAILEDFATEWFEDSIKNEFMLVVRQFKENMKKHVPGAVHVDGSCRIQTVSQKCDSMFRQVLEEFYKITGIPMLINTSLNRRGEPLCELPEHAIDCFIGSGMNLLYLEGIRGKKMDPFTSASFPILLNNIELMNITTVINDMLYSSFSFKRTMDLENSKLTKIEYEVLLNCDGKNRISEIAEICHISIEQCLNLVRNFLTEGILKLDRKSIK